MNTVDEIRERHSVQFTPDAHVLFPIMLDAFEKEIVTLYREVDTLLTVIANYEDRPAITPAMAASLLDALPCVPVEGSLPPLEEAQARLAYLELQNLAQRYRDAQERFRNAAAAEPPEGVTAGGDDSSSPETP